MSGESDLAFEWLYQTLSADALLTIAAPGGVHEDTGPEGAAYPIVLCQWLGGSDVPPNLNRTGKRIWTTMLWRVYAVGVEGTHDAGIRSADMLIDANLDRAAGAVEGGYVYQSQRQSPWRRHVPEDGVVYFELGGLYRLELQNPVRA